MADLIVNNARKAMVQSPLDGRTLYDTIQEALEDNPIEEIPIESWEPDYNDYPNHLRPQTNRFIGQKMMIRNPPEGDSPREYWFKNGIADADLVRYTSEFDDSYKWEKIKPGSGGSGGSGGGGISLNGDPMQLVKGDGSLTAGFMEVRHVLDGVFSGIAALPNCNGYIITMSADKRYATIYAAHGCASLSFKITEAYRLNASDNFSQTFGPGGWVEFARVPK